MKQIYSLLFLFLFIAGFAQAPDGYYANATGTGYTLKTQLYNIIKDHTVQTYGGLYVTYETSDIDNFFENDGSVLDMYSENPSGTDPYIYTIATTQRCGNYTNEGDCYNREHIIPQSVFNEQSPMVSDAHFITPTDGKVNGIRSNYPHSVVATATQTTLNGSKLGASTTAGYSGPVFEPIDEFKGDIARMYFYFATRYENTVAGYNYPMFNNSSGKVFTNAFLSQLIAWHNQDPVSPREIARNNAIYARQNNRNPFIDHPEYVAAVWTTQPADTDAPSAVTNLTVTTTTSNSATLTWTAATDNVGVTGYDLYLDGTLKSTHTGLTATVSGLLPSTTYTFYVIARDDERNSSVASTSVEGVTTAAPTGGSGATELFFSEYVEGSSLNKALEIANFTGAAVNLSGYSIKKQSNGTGAWSAGLSLTGTLNSGAVFVLVDPGIATTCYTVANANLSSAQEAYNGNDPMGLFKDGKLIDIIGTFDGGSTNFAADVTLRRKSSIKGPNTTFDKTAEWDSYPNNTCDGIGTHSLATVPNVDTEAPTAVTNLTVTTTTSNSATLTWTAATDNVGVTGYDLYLDGTLKSTHTGLTATVSGLLPSTTYTFYVIARDDERNSSVASTSVEGVTTAVPTGGSGATELFFSEYVEGSSLNKALEIANFTGAAVNLTGYSIRKQSNGTGAWSAGLNLTGTLNSGAVFVLVDPGIATTCYTVANANLSSAQEAYNGNDPMGLFKDGKLIDIIGTFDGGSTNFAADVTLRRKSSIKGPNTTFDKTAEWDSYPNNTCDGIGTHSLATLSNIDFDANEFNIYPNPSNGNFKINFENSNEKYSVQVFSVLGQKVFEKEYTNNSSATVNNLQKGVYLVKITNDTKSVTKKLIVN